MPELIASGGSDDTAPLGLPLVGMICFGLMFWRAEKSTTFGSASFGE